MLHDTKRILYASLARGMPYVIMVRYADDIVVGFQHEADARRFWEAMRGRLAQYALTLPPCVTVVAASINR